MNDNYLEIRINTTNTQQLTLTALSAESLPAFTAWLRDLDTVESIELRHVGGLVWSVI